MPRESLNLPYITVTGAVFLLIFLSFVVFRPQITHLQTTNTAIDSLREQLQERQQFLTSIDQKSAQLQANAAYDQELRVVVPAEEAFADVLRLIDRQAAGAAVQVRSVENKTNSTQVAQRVAQALGNTVVTPKTLTVHGATINLRGSYQQVRQFLAAMENSVRFMDIGEITLNHVAEQPDVLEGSFATEFYSLSAP